MKHTTHRDQADAEVEKIKSVLKNTGLDYYIEESPFRLSVHVKKSFIKDFSPKLAETDVFLSTSSPILPTTTKTILSPPWMANDSGLSSQESVQCSSCLEKDHEIENVRKELIKVLIESKKANEKIAKDLDEANVSLINCNKKLKYLETEAEQLKKEIQTKSEQLKQKNKNTDSLKSRLCLLYTSPSPRD